MQAQAGGQAALQGSAGPHGCAVSKRAGAARAAGLSGCSRAVSRGRLPLPRARRLPPCSRLGGDKALAGFVRTKQKVLQGVQGVNPVDSVKSCPIWAPCLQGRPLASGRIQRAVVRCMRSQCAGPSAVRALACVW